MGIFDIFRRERKNEEIGKIKFNELGKVILEKKKELRTEEIAKIGIIKGMIDELIKDFDSKISVLNNLNLEGKKAEERFKLLVKGNVEKYIAYLNVLKEKLDNLKDDNLSDLTNNIHSLLVDFDKKSSINFEKATVLIGKELENVRISIKNFYNNIKNTLKNNKKLIEDSEIIKNIEEKFEEIEKIKKTKEEIQEEIVKFDKLIISSKEEIISLKDKIEEIKRGIEYNEEQMKKEEIERKKENLKKEISNLKDKIDFKELAGNYHSNEKIMKVIKEYRDSFHYTLERDRGQSLIEIIMKDKEEVKKLINKIIDSQKEISDFKEKKDVTIEIKNDIEKIEDKIRNFVDEKSKGEKRILQSDEKIEGKREILKNGLAKLNFEMI